MAFGDGYFRAAITARPNKTLLATKRLPEVMLVVDVNGRIARAIGGREAVSSAVTKWQQGDNPQIMPLFVS